MCKTSPSGDFKPGYSLAIDTEITSSYKTSLTWQNRQVQYINIDLASSDDVERHEDVWIDGDPSQQTQARAWHTCSTRLANAICITRIDSSLEFSSISTKFGVNGALIVLYKKLMDVWQDVSLDFIAWPSSIFVESLGFGRPSPWETNMMIWSSRVVIRKILCLGWHKI